MSWLTIAFSHWLYFWKISSLNHRLVNSLHKKQNISQHRDVRAEELLLSCVQHIGENDSDRILICLHPLFCHFICHSLWIPHQHVRAARFQKLLHLNPPKDLRINKDEIWLAAASLVWKLLQQKQLVDKAVWQNADWQCAKRIKFSIFFLSFL